MQRAVTQAGACFAARNSAKGATRTVSVSGELDLAVSDAFAAAIDDALRHAPRTVVVDLGAAEFIDVSGVRTLLRAHRQAVSRSVRLVIIPAPDHVHKVFALCGVERELPFLATAPRGRDARRTTDARASRESRRACAPEGGALPAGGGIDRHLELRRRAAAAASVAHEIDAASRHV
jgi:anti-sigma B factor antagonist